MKLNGLLRLTLMLFWLAAVHHCGLEELVQDVAGLASHRTMADGACSSHAGAGQPDHQEGQPCSWATTTLQTPEAATAAAPILHFTLINSFEISEPIIRPEKQSSRTPDLARAHPPSDLSELSNSLALAPNAPPAVA